MQQIRGTHCPVNPHTPPLALTHRPSYPLCVPVYACKLILSTSRPVVSVELFCFVGARAYFQQPAYHTAIFVLQLKHPSYL